MSDKYFVYSPKVEAYIYTSDKTPEMYDISDDIVGGNISRKVNAPSTASLKLANNGYKYDRKFKPMDRIVIYLTRTERVLVFTGYITAAPLYSVAGEVSIECGCTLTRLQRLYWDEGLQSSIDEYFDLAKQVGFNVGASGGERDGGMAIAIRRVLGNVAGWDPNKVNITDIPEEIAEYAASVYALTNSEDEAFKEAMIALFQNGNSGSITINGQTKFDRVPEEYREKIREMSAKYGFPAWLLASMTEAESNWNPKADNGAARGLCQIEYAGSCRGRMTSKKYPFFIEGKGNYFSGNNWHDGNWSIEIGAFLLESATKKAKASAYWSTDGLRNGKVIYHYYTRGVNTTKPFDENDARQKNLARRIVKYYDESASITASVGTTNEQSWTSSSDISPAAKAVVDKAIGEIGVKEDPPRSNRTKYGAAYQLNGAFWCAIFCWWVFNEVGAGDAFMGGSKTASTIAIANYYKKHNQWFTTPKIGDMALFGRDGKTIGHVGIVVDVDIKGNFTTVEGNSGEQVKRIQRQKGSAVGFARPSYDGIAPTDEAGRVDSESGAITSFNTNIWWRSNQIMSGAANPISLNLTGVRAYVNDSSVYSKISSLCSSSLRSFSSGPGGEFWAWFPDKFGVAFDGSTVVDIPNIEVTDVSSTFNDSGLCTHTYCYGSYLEDFVAKDEQSKFMMTNGIATIDNVFKKAPLFGAEEVPSYKGAGYSPSGDNDKVSDLLKMFLNIPEGKESDYTPNEIYRRYGLRPKKLTPVSNASNYSYIPYMTSLFALIEAWQSMYSCSATTTFLPHVFPGMRVNFKDEDIQFYVDGVNHSFSYQNGFTTALSLSCPTSKNRDYFIKDGGGTNAL